MLYGKFSKLLFVLKTGKSWWLHERPSRIYNLYKFANTFKYYPAVYIYIFFQFHPQKLLWVRSFLNLLQFPSKQVILKHCCLVQNFLFSGNILLFFLNSEVGLPLNMTVAKICSIHFIVFLILIIYRSEPCWVHYLSI